MVEAVGNKQGGKRAEIFMRGSPRILFNACKKLMVFFRFTFSIGTVPVEPVFLFYLKNRIVVSNCSPVIVGVVTKVPCGKVVMNLRL